MGKNGQNEILFANILSVLSPIPSFGYRTKPLQPGFISVSIDFGEVVFYHFSHSVKRSKYLPIVSSAKSPMFSFFHFKVGTLGGNDSGSHLTTTKKTYLAIVYNVLCLYLHRSWLVCVGWLGCLVIRQ